MPELDGPDATLIDHQCQQSIACFRSGALGNKSGERTISKGNVLAFTDFQLGTFHLDEESAYRQRLSLTISTFYQDISGSNQISG